MKRNENMNWPAKAESGEGLPPRVIELVEYSKMDNSLIVGSELREIAQYLQASLLREKGLREEVERLKGLLREVESEGYRSGWFCEEGCKCDADKLHVKIKAAVTGE